MALENNINAENFEKLNKLNTILNTTLTMQIKSVSGSHLFSSAKMLKYPKQD